MKILFLATFVLSAIASCFGQEVTVTQFQYQSALSNGYRVADKYSYRATTVEESFTDGEKIGYEKHVTENLPPDRSRYTFQSRYRGEREDRQVIKIGGVSYCKEGNGKWEKANCDRITGISNLSVRSQEWSRSNARFNNNPVTQIRSYLIYSSPQEDASKPERVLFVENKTMLDKEGKIVFAESTTGVVESKEVLSRSVTKYEYGLTNLRIEAPVF